MLYTLHCHDPRYPLGYPADQDTDLDALRARCDQQNAAALEEDGFEQFWIVQEGRIIYPPVFVDMDVAEVPEACPWGVISHRETVLPGVSYVTTHRHGGYHLSPEVNARVPADVRRVSGWYEQDVEAALVAYFVPLPQADRADVLVILENQYPELYTRIIRGEVSAGG